jgi:anaerobic ribonucleoside-triphosphate reductase
MTGPKDLDQMREALKAYAMGPLSPEELKRAHRIGDHVHLHHRRLFA